jgi:hypothetical protein
MKHENYGICTTISTAFAEPVSPGVSSALPADHAGDFAEPLRAQDCCAVIRKEHGQHGKAMPPRRCRSRRREYNPKNLERAKLTCQAHSRRESEAQSWMAARKAGG